MSTATFPKAGRVKKRKGEKKRRRRRRKCPWRRTRRKRRGQLTIAGRERRHIHC
jgi:hypothetical protein